MELLESELSFCAALLDVKRACVRLNSSGQTTEQELRSVFFNWDDLIDFSRNIYFLVANRLFLHLKSVPTCHDLKIGEILLDIIPEMEVFRRFCVRQAISPDSFRQYVASIPGFSNVLSQPFLTESLILPMQRLTKYPLLVGRILKETSPDLPDHKDLSQAMSMIIALLNSINAQVRYIQNGEYLKWLRYRIILPQFEDDAAYLRWFTNPTENLQMLESGRFYKVSSSKQILGFLFPKYLLLALVRKGSKELFPITMRSVMNDTLTLKPYKEPVILDQALVTVHIEPANNVPDELTVPLPINQFVSTASPYTDTVEQQGEGPSSIMQCVPTAVTVVLSLYIRKKGQPSDVDITQATHFLSMRMAPDTDRERWISLLNELTGH